MRSVALLQGFPFRFVQPERVSLGAEGAVYLWQPSQGAFYRGVAVPPFLLLELAGQTAEVYIRQLLGPAQREMQLRLGAVDRVTCEPPANPLAALLVTVRRDAASGRIFRSACSVTAGDQLCMTGLLTHVLVPAKEVC